MQRRMMSREGRPLTSAVPEVGLSRPRIIRIVVDLPAPLGPRNPVTHARPDREGEVVDGERVVVPLGQIGGIDHVSSFSIAVAVSANGS